MEEVLNKSREEMISFIITILQMLDIEIIRDIYIRSVAKSLQLQGSIH